MSAQRLLIVALCAVLCACGQGDAAAQREIRALMHAQFDKPQAPLQIAPVIVAGDHAIADWSQLQIGGRALLRREQGQWRIVLCAGDALRDQQLLLEAGVPTREAERLTQGLLQAEEAINEEALQRFASFHRMVRMDAQGEHPPH